jgi:two-component system response regulator AtoC
LVLVVSRDRAELARWTDRVRGLGYPTHGVSSDAEARLAVAERNVGLMLAHCDRLATAGELLSSTRSVGRDVPVLLLLPALGVQDCARAISLGAREALDDACTDAELGHALLKASTDLESVATGEAGPGRAPFGQSKAMKHLLEQLHRAASGQATVLLRGESGTGKELIARALHAQSPRASGPFVKVHCAALPDTLLESELFGYERGAFTGAVSRKPGRVELAEGGTLFLDEIGDITPAFQVKLLRLLQEREYEALGGRQTLRANVRFVAATHRVLDEMVKLGEFREDLFYRLNVVTLWLPPLRARRDDIAPLATRFCREFAIANGKPDVQLSEEALRRLTRERWPGNVRQLQNFLEKLVVLTDQSLITAEDIDLELSARGTSFATEQSQQTASRGRGVESAPSEHGAPRTLSEEVRLAERKALVRALRSTQGNRTLAARVLGVSRATLYKKLDEHGLS